jgi:hypothetical protein
MRPPSLPLALLLAAAASFFPACDKELRTDEDGDGFPLTVDCDDTNELVFPGADERCDGVDDDCDGNIDESGVDGPGFWRDADGDGHGDGAFPSTACVAPVGYVDNDADCDDLDPLSGPGADERCDLEDNDCDGDIDEDPVDAPTGPATKTATASASPPAARSSPARPPRATSATRTTATTVTPGSTPRPFGTATSTRTATAASTPSSPACRRADTSTTTSTATTLRPR